VATETDTHTTSLTLYLSVSEYKEKCKRITRLT
jgi:hypothetical protein